MTTKSVKDLLNKNFMIGFEDKDRIEWFVPDIIYLGISWNCNGFSFHFNEDNFKVNVPLDSVSRLISALQLCGLSELADKLK